MASRRTHSTDSDPRSPLYELSSRKRMARKIFHQELAPVEVLAATTGNYRVFMLKQREQDRQIEVPKPALAPLHWRLCALLDRLQKPNYLHSGVRTRGCATNARAHAGAVPLVTLLIKPYYAAVGAARVAGFFTGTMACSPDVAALLTRLATYDDHVPSGSCLGQLLAYCALQSMLDELQALAQARGLRFTCYADDLTWSGKGATPEFLRQAKKVLLRFGFANFKERCYGAHDQKIVTGMLIEGTRCSELPSREFEFWQSAHALAGADIEQRVAAAGRLAGMALVPGAREARFVAKLQGQRRLRLGTPTLP